MANYQDMATYRVAKFEDDFIDRNQREMERSGWFDTKAGVGDEQEDGDECDK